MSLLFTTLSLRSYYLSIWARQSSSLMISSPMAFRSYSNSWRNSSFTLHRLAIYSLSRVCFDSSSRILSMREWLCSWSLRRTFSSFCFWLVCSCWLLLTFETYVRRCWQSAWRRWFSSIKLSFWSDKDWILSIAPAKSLMSMGGLFFTLLLFLPSLGLSRVPCLMEESKSKGNSFVALNT